jgi:hypothetical protein
MPAQAPHLRALDSQKAFFFGYLSFVAFDKRK